MKVKIDVKNHEWNKKTTKIKISEKQFNNLMADIDKDIKNPPRYDLPNGAHCATWAMQKLQNAKIVDFGVNFDGGLGEAVKTNPFLQGWFGMQIPPLLDEKLPPFMDNKSTIPSFPLSQFENPFTLPTIYDPLILDLDNDGIETTTLDNGVYFDHNSDNISLKTSWVGNDDALLVVDKNSNKTIDSGNLKCA
ncbi:hypothetical protein [Campylobacter sputorum]|uniref:hypothetical protein n=1 Tax=Campylobacter sputorum TaxID=206 RepID=UPI00053BE513|nr:hypothetical protein [Campylobacter sputorum]